MHGCMDGQTDGSMDGWMDGWTDRQATEAGSTVSAEVQKRKNMDREQQQAVAQFGCLMMTNFYRQIVSLVIFFFFCFMMNAASPSALLIYEGSNI